MQIKHTHVHSTYYLITANSLINTQLPHYLSAGWPLEVFLSVPIDELVCRIDHLAQLSEGQTDQSVDKGQTIAIFY